MKTKFTSTIAGGAILITVIGIIGKGLGFFREVLNAAYFGLSDAYEIYLVAAILPLTINTIILYFSQNYFIPVYKKIISSDSQKAVDFIENSLGIFIVLSVILSTILYFSASFLTKLYIFSYDTIVIEKANLIFRICLLTIPMNAISSVLSAYLQAERKFDKPAHSHLLLNITLIILIPLFASQWGVYVLPIGIVAGYLLQVIYLFKMLGLKVSPINFFRFSFKKLKEAAVPFLLITFLIEIISQVHILADRFLYERVESGGIAALNYANHVFVLPIILVSMALTTTIFPDLTELVQSNNKVDLKKKLSKAFSVNLAIFVPVSIIFIFSGDSIIKLFFMRGAFTAQDSLLTYNVFQLYSLSLIFYSVYALLNKIFYSALLVKELLLLIISGAIIKVVLNLLLVNSLGQNGLALSSTITYIYYCITSLLFISFKLEINITGEYFKSGLYYILNGIFCLLVVEIIVTIFQFPAAIYYFMKIGLLFFMFAVNLYILNDPVLKTIQETYQNYVNSKAN